MIGTGARAMALMQPIKQYPQAAIRTLDAPRRVRRDMTCWRGKTRTLLPRTCSGLAEDQQRRAAEGPPDHSVRPAGRVEIAMIRAAYNRNSASGAWISGAGATVVLEGEPGGEVLEPLTCPTSTIRLVSNTSL
jgi:hypothetical protein